MKDDGKVGAAGRLKHLMSVKKRGKSVESVAVPDACLHSRQRHKKDSQTHTCINRILHAASLSFCAFPSFPPVTFTVLGS